MRTGPGLQRAGSPRNSPARPAGPTPLQPLPSPGQGGETGDGDGPVMETPRGPESAPTEQHQRRALCERWLYFLIVIMRLERLLEMYIFLNGSPSLPPHPLCVIPPVCVPPRPPCKSHALGFCPPTPRRPCIWNLINKESLLESLCTRHLFRLAVLWTELLPGVQADAEKATREPPQPPKSQDGVGWGSHGHFKSTIRAYLGA